MPAQTKGPCFGCNNSIESGMPDKDSSICAACAIRVDYMRKNREDITEGKRCPKCEKVKPKAKFHPDRTKKDGLSSYCKKCKLKAAREREKKEKAETKMFIANIPPKEERIKIMENFRKKWQHEEAGAVIEAEKRPSERHFEIKQIEVPGPAPVACNVNPFGFGNFSITDDEAMKVKAVLLKLHDFLIGG